MENRFKLRKIYVGLYATCTKEGFTYIDLTKGERHIRLCESQLHGLYKRVQCVVSEGKK
jgi:hypothetical protein